MSMTLLTRRGFLKAAGIFCGSAAVGIRFTGRAMAAAKQMKDYMSDRINGTYGADAKFKVRASQDNAQVKALYKDYLHQPMSHESEHLLHTTWLDRSKGLKKLQAEGKYPNPRAKEFEGPYPFE